MSSDDDFDYMSENFLAKCIKDDIRPGLINDRTQQRSHNIYKKKTITDEENKQQHKSVKILETERREEGLQETISDNNKGFALLKKMGYTPGQPIGKAGTGLVEPILIALKSDRGGLGRESALREIAAEKLSIKKKLTAKNEKAASIEDYRARMMKKASERHVKDDLRKSQKVCQKLDTDEGYSQPEELWMWPPQQTSQNSEGYEERDDGDESDIPVPKTKNNSMTKSEDDDKEKEEEEEEEDEEIEYEDSEKLEMITLYLRKTYFYCVWCAVKYDDDKDLRDSCPGSTRDVH